jgi:hypothetical protein
MMLALCLSALASRPVCEPSECGGAHALRACPASTAAAADLVLTLSPTNLYFYNAAPHTTTISYVTEDGSEKPALRMASGTRQEVSALAGEVWRARALRPGHPQDQQLMLEHRVGLVSIKDCDCPQPEFIDVSLPNPVRLLPVRAVFQMVADFNAPPPPSRSAPNLPTATPARPRSTR